MPAKKSFEVSKTTVIFGLILLALGYFIGNTLPVTDYTANQDLTNEVITSSVNQDQSSKIQGSINFEVPSFARFIGDESAPISLVEFGDYQCPFCKRFFDQTEPQLMQEYVTTGKAKFYFLDFVVVGQDSLTLAEGAWCAEEQGKYYQYHDYVYSHQGPENSGWGTPDKVKSFANDLGLDVEEFSLCLDSKKYESRVQQLTAFAENLGSTGTPTLFIGNEDLGFTQITGAQPYSVYSRVIGEYLQ